jgi:hypothetical protein
VIGTWTVDPTSDWLEQNQQWLLEANLEGTPRCQAVLTSYRCELIADHNHECPHMIRVNQRVAELPLDV